MSSKVILSGGIGLIVDGIVLTNSSPDQSKYVTSLEIRLRSSENDVISKEAQLQSQIANHTKERNVLSTRAETAEKTMKSTQAELELLKSQAEESESKAKTIQGELDDLLLVLGEMEEKTTRYRKKIKSLGGEVTDDEEE
jgi:intracellular protein transport protein USO1